MSTLLLSTFLVSCATEQIASKPVQGGVQTFTVALANTHVLDVSGVRLMIDSGKAGNEGTLIDKMSEAGIDPASIDYLILTHGHTDHAGGAAYFKRHFGTRIIASAAEASMLAEGKNDDLCPTNMVGGVLKPFIMRESYPPVTADVVVGDQFDLASIGAHGIIVSIPSHTPGSIAVLIDNKAFVGDLVRGGLLQKTMPARHFYMCDLEKNNSDIRKILANERIDTWYTGHMGPLSVDSVKEAFAQWQ
ncbi:MBL fold metallo-hydrolase [Marinobacter sp. NFXS9]|uniref:MBL fold metallo-hydrolase n=1 Tax=Marinobacter sp. NFXS9 TaxID=2818433 RepID=UPI0032E00BD6